MIPNRILISADFQSDRLGASYARAFERLGWDVEQFAFPEQFGALAWPARNRVLHRATIRSLAIRRLWSIEFNLALQRAAIRANSEWLLLFNAEWVMPETIRAIQRAGVKVAVFHADNPFPPHCANRPETLELAKEVDLYMVWSQRLVQKLETLGVKKAAFLPFGWDEQIHPFQSGRSQGTWPGVTFVGGWDRERELFLEELAQHVPLRIHGPGYWGTRTRRGSRVRQAWSGGPLVMSDAALAIRDSAISLNILRTQHVIDGQPDGVIMRHFEVPGAGGFLLSTRSSTAKELFPEEETGAYFSGLAECIEKCKQYIHDQSGRQQMVARTHEIVKSKHTYVQRARDILAHMEPA